MKKFGIDGPEAGKLIIDLFTEWCGPCKWVSPILQKLRDDGLIHLIQIDVDKNSELGQELNIHSIPTLLFFKDGNLLEKNIEINGQIVVNKGIMVGAANEDTLRKIINQM